jgi:hypothetical protein
LGTAHIWTNQNACRKGNFGGESVELRPTYQ